MINHTLESLNTLVSRIDPIKVKIGSSTGWMAGNGIPVDEITIEYDMFNAKSLLDNTFSISTMGKSEIQIEAEIRAKIEEIEERWASQ